MNYDVVIHGYGDMCRTISVALLAGQYLADIVAASG
jgi:hypothetical protein